MSGDVQPRKRKDKKRKKDELEEPKGTAAALGEGDVFMHASHDHGTGGHWCAKVIFFSLLAVLITLVGLIILENRGLSELEANSVESRYSGVLEGWLEDAPDDDHHDVHTLELKHHEDDEDDHDVGDDHGDEDEHDDEDEHSEEDEQGNEELDDDDHDNDEDDEEQDDDDRNIDTAEDEDEDVRHSYSKYFGDNDEDETENDEDDDQDNENDDEDEDQNDDENNLSDELDDNQDDDDDDVNGNDDEDDQSVEKYDDENDEENDDARDDEDEEEHEHDEEDEGETEETEMERIEKEASDEDPISLELPALPEAGDDDDDGNNQQDTENDNTAEDDGDSGEDDFLDGDDEQHPVVERITVPAGKPFVEVEEEESSEKPPDTLEEEEEYEQKQEELRRQKEQASHMWLKLVVGGALLVATHAVVRRATASRGVPESEERVAREDTPIDRRMPLIPEEPSEPVRTVPQKKAQERYMPFVEEAAKKVPFVTKSTPALKQPSEEEVEPDDIEEIEADEEKKEGRELYSDEEDAEDDDEEIVEQKQEMPKQTAHQLAPPIPTASKPTAPVVKKPDPEPEADEEVPDDVEIIDDEQLDEEMGEEEVEEEEISDVDDAELLTRLEAKYGRLPEPERPGQRHKDGGNSLEDEWPGEPSDPYWRQQLDSIERELRQGSWLGAAERAGAAALRDSARARYYAAVALDRAAEAQRDNRLLTRAIDAYLHLLKMNERLPDKRLVEIANRTLDRIQFRGNYMNAEPVHRLLIRRFPNDTTYRNNLSVSFLMANRADLAEEVLKETLQRWPNDRLALAHYGFVLKNQHNRFEEAVEAFQRALEGDEGPACEPRYYYHLGDALLLLGRYPEANEVHKRAAKFGHFLSPAQRSLYNVPRLKSQPWWDVEATPYARLARALENSWRDILKEGEAAQAIYEKEKEGLKERGEWSQLDLFARGQEIPERCKRAPVTCAVVRGESAAVGCRRGQVKFSAMQPGTHVRPHVGPTNCRLRMHLGLTNTKDTYLRVDQETRQWQEGKVLMFDDSFEHEVWHNGTGQRLVLIVDVWHPDLTAQERRQLSAI